MSQQRYASVSLDADNLWSYMKTHGESGWESRPSYLDVFVPYVLEVLDKLSIKITFFIVGVDAAEEKNHNALSMLAPAGHELGNHSFEHEPWLHLYSREEIEAEIDKADHAIQKATGQKPIGFRGPGFSWSPTLLSVLADRDYLFDASSLPTYLGPVARWYYFKTAKLSPEQREERGELFGKFSDGFRSVKPYYWKLEDSKQLLEIPVTTVPLVKTPFHFSYLLYLARFSQKLMMAYLMTAVAACRVTNTAPSYLLHPLDIIGCDQLSELRFFPGMDVTGAEKTRTLERVLKVLSDHFELVTMGEHAARISQSGDLPVKRTETH